MELNVSFQSFGVSYLKLQSYELLSPVLSFGVEVGKFADLISWLTALFSMTTICEWFGLSH
jgi:hypothetical protein